MRSLLPFLVICPAALWAQDFATRDGDTRFDRDAMVARLSGQDLVFFDNGRSRYYADGRYSYTYDGDPRESAGGYWTVDDAGVVCVSFITGHARCDLYVMNAGRLVLIDAKGNRYPVRD